MALPGLAGKGWTGWDAAHIKNQKWNGKTLVPGMTYGATNVAGDPGSRAVGSMVAPAAPVPVVVPPTRTDLVNVLTPDTAASGGGYDLANSGGGGGAGNVPNSGVGPLGTGPGVTAISAGVNNAGGGQSNLAGGSTNPGNAWGVTPSGVQSSARNLDGSWGTPVSGNPTGGVATGGAATTNLGAGPWGASISNQPSTGWSNPFSGLFDGWGSNSGSSAGRANSGGGSSGSSNGGGGGGSSNGGGGWGGNQGGQGGGGGWGGSWGGGGGGYQR